MDILSHIDLKPVYEVIKKYKNKTNYIFMKKTKASNAVPIAFGEGSLEEKTQKLKELENEKSM